VTSRAQISAVRTLGSAHGVSLAHPRLNGAREARMGGEAEGVGGAVTLGDKEGGGRIHTRRQGRRGAHSHSETREEGGALTLGDKGGGGHTHTRRQGRRGVHSHSETREEGGALTLGRQGRRGCTHTWRQGRRGCTHTRRQGRRRMHSHSETREEGGALTLGDKGEGVHSHSETSPLCPSRPSPRCTRYPELIVTEAPRRTSRLTGLPPTSCPSWPPLCTSLPAATTGAPWVHPAARPQTTTQRTRSTGKGCFKLAQSWSTSLTSSRVVLCDPSWASAGTGQGESGPVSMSTLALVLSSQSPGHQRCGWTGHARTARTPPGPPVPSSSHRRSSTQ